MSLDLIREKALELKDLREDKEKLNDRLKEINDNIKNLEEKQIAVMMDDEGISDVTVDGVRVKRGVVFRGGVTKHTDKDAFKYLFDTDNGGALKQVVSIDLTQRPDITDMLDQLNIPYTVEYSIHHMTLSSILRELVGDGKLTTDDFDKYSIYAQPQIKVEIK